MELDTLILSDSNLARIDPFFASIRQGYSKKVTLIFTSGKSDPRWTGSTADGVTLPKLVRVDDEAKTCSGTSLIDLLKLLGTSYNPPQVTGKRVIPGNHQPNYFRLLVAEVIVHEIAHTCQGWQIGNNFEAYSREEKLTSAERQKDCREMFPNGSNCVFSKNMLEGGAYDFDGRWSKAHRAEVHAGKFDFMLPMTVMRGLFPNMKNVYR